MRFSSGKIGKRAISVKPKPDGRERSYSNIPPVLVISGQAVIDRLRKDILIVAAQLVAILFVRPG